MTGAEPECVCDDASCQAAISDNHVCIQDQCVLPCDDDSNFGVNDDECTDDNTVCQMSTFVVDVDLFCFSTEIRCRT